MGGTSTLVGAMKRQLAEDTVKKQARQRGAALISTSEIGPKNKKKKRLVYQVPVGQEYKFYA